MSAYPFDMFAFSGNTELNAFARSLHWQSSLAHLRNIQSNFLADRFSYNSALHGLEMKDVGVFVTVIKLVSSFLGGGFGGKGVFRG